jgi:hypothetical protein
MKRTEVFGFHPRNVCGGIQDPLDNLSDALSPKGVEKIFASTDRKEFTERDRCSRLVYLEVDETLTEVTPVIASQFVLGHVIEILRTEDLTAVRRLAQMAEMHGGGLFGGGYEVYCHKAIPYHPETKGYLIREWTFNGSVLTRKGVAGRLSLAGG